MSASIPTVRRIEAERDPSRRRMRVSLVVEMDYDMDELEEARDDLMTYCVTDLGNQLRNGGSVALDPVTPSRRMVLPLPPMTRFAFEDVDGSRIQEPRTARLTPAMRVLVGPNQESLNEQYAARERAIRNVYLTANSQGGDVVLSGNTSAREQIGWLVDAFRARTGGFPDAYSNLRGPDFRAAREQARGVREGREEPNETDLQRQVREAAQASRAMSATRQTLEAVERARPSAPTNIHPPPPTAPRPPTGKRHILMEEDDQ